MALDPSVQARLDLLCEKGILPPGSVDSSVIETLSSFPPQTSALLLDDFHIKALRQDIPNKSTYLVKLIQNWSVAYTVMTTNRARMMGMGMMGMTPPTPGSASTAVPGIFVPPATLSSLDQRIQNQIKLLITSGLIHETIIDDEIISHLSGFPVAVAVETLQIFHWELRQRPILNKTALLKRLLSNKSLEMMNHQPLTTAFSTPVEVAPTVTGILHPRVQATLDALSSSGYTLEQEIVEQLSTFATAVGENILQEFIELTNRQVVDNPGAVLRKMMEIRDGSNPLLVVAPPRTTQGPVSLDPRVHQEVQTLIHASILHEHMLDENIYYHLAAFPPAVALEVLQEFQSKVQSQQAYNRVGFLKKLMNSRQTQEEATAIATAQVVKEAEVMEDEPMIEESVLAENQHDGPFWYACLLATCKAEGYDTPNVSIPRKDGQDWTLHIDVTLPNNVTCFASGRSSSSQGAREIASLQIVLQIYSEASNMTHIYEAVTCNLLTHPVEVDLLLGDGEIPPDPPAIEDPLLSVAQAGDPYQQQQQQYQQYQQQYQQYQQLQQMAAVAAGLDPMSIMEGITLPSISTTVPSMAVMQAVPPPMPLPSLALQMQLDQSLY